MAELTKACATAYGADGRFVILARRPGTLTIHLRRDLQ
jgi:hypothetical protein